MKRILLALATATAAACSTATPEQQIVNDAASALGGRDRILAVKTIVLEGEGSNGNLGQDMTPEATGQKFALSGYKRSIDVADSRARIEQTRTPNFAYFQGQQPQKQVLGVDGDIAYNVAPNGTATRAANAAARDRRADIFHHPITIVRAALDPAAKLANPRTAGNESVVEVTTAEGPDLHARDRQQHEAAVARGLDVRERQHGRRRHRDELRRLSGRQRPEAPLAADDQDRQVHDGRDSGVEADR